MRFLRALRLDDSDDEIYPRAATAGEWVVPGTFVFTFGERPPEQLDSGEQAAFRHGFLGLSSFGWSTLAVVVEMPEAEQRQVLESLARHFVEAYGAPDMEAALVEARGEVAFCESLCTPDINTVLSVQRDFVDGEVKEAFRVHRPKSESDWESAPVFRIVPETGGEPR
ncbi:hypothetical protein GJ672_00270 [Spiribacter sp. 2438]|uniref:DUF6505 family protein n=1 Tax=Spiribacter sp. 2438 TaxID=2666185 RepID=UPI0012AFD783|nr:DUF6505 family protein [Spiribacter sp. 2438]QGM20860.1 hypothetical protein GJ672_00270 [Spiribacter sp. 2438]